MTTLHITKDQLGEVRAGDRLVAIDDMTLSAAKVFTDSARRLWLNGPIGIPFHTDSPVEGYLYPDSLVGRSITIERDEPEAETKPEPAPELAKIEQEPTVGTKGAPMPEAWWTTRERNALRRNRHYENTLRLLDDGKGGAVDLRTVVSRVNFYDSPRGHSHTAGTLAAFYSWTERVADYTWRLTPAGRRVLAVLDQRKG